MPTFFSIEELDRLVENGRSEDDKRARRFVLQGLQAALEASDPALLMRSSVCIDNGALKIGGIRFPIDHFKRIIVIGGGKAAGYMAQEIEVLLGEDLTEGYVNILQGTSNLFKTRKIILNEAGHPLPTKSGVLGVEKMTSLIKDPSNTDLVICLISGGASALMPLPKDEVSLEEQRTITNALLRAGANIHELNCVRKHLSKVKGGQLAVKAYPATVVSLIISDVVGDDLDVIASGPTAPDKSTYKDGVEVLKKYGLWDSLPPNSKNILEKGLQGALDETPKPGDPKLEKVFNVIIGSNMTACRAAEAKLKSNGLNTVYLTSHIEGESCGVGMVLGSVIRSIKAGYSSIVKPVGIVAGGETTVTVTGQGKGGRNMELILGCSVKIRDLDAVSSASIGTDGIDGPTDAAGAIADGHTISRASEMNMNARLFLDENDSYNFFSRLNDLVKTGPTGTNVNDVAILVVL